MRIPDALFPLINRVMRLLLNSPLHGLMSGSVLVVYYKGRKSGRRRWTPVRYVKQSDSTLACLTGRETGWWPNFLEPRDVELQLAGRRLAARALAQPDDAERKAEVLREVLRRFPADAPYHGIVLKRGQAITPSQFEQAVARDVVVLFDVSSRQ